MPFQTCPYLYVNSNYKKLIEESAHKSFTLAFITGYRNGKATWDCGVTPDAGLVKKLGHCILSFGGASAKTNELAGAITDVKKLAEAYTDIMREYGCDELDFDVEGSSIKQPEALERRNRALAAIQKALPATKINFTLPCMPFGLEKDGLALLKNAKQCGVRVNLVNIMAMDYGQRVKDMGKAAIDAANATRKQLQGLGLADTLVGITPMIGVNDTAGEVFTLQDAAEVRAFADKTPWVGLLAFWSLNRDNGSGATDPRASMTHSGIEQKPYKFTRIFS